LSVNIEQSEGFVQARIEEIESLGRLKDGILHKGEIAHRKQLQAAHGSEDIIAAICSHLKVSREDLLRKGGENRKIAIYLMKKLTGMSNKQIGHLFGGLSYSAVAKVYQRFSAEAKTNKPLRKLQYPIISAT